MIGRQTIEVSCAVDIEQTAEFFHAHAIPELDIRPGDSVVVHGIPNVGFGEHVTMSCRATVTRASWLDRMWAQATGLLELTQLYEVGFDPKEAA